MNITLHVYYCTEKYIEGFKFIDYIMNENPSYIYMGDIEIDNPFETPDLSVINNARISQINSVIKEHKTQINLLDNQIKDLLCIENKGE